MLYAQLAVHCRHLGGALPVYEKFEWSLWEQSIANVYKCNTPTHIELVAWIAVSGISALFGIYIYIYIYKQNHLGGQCYK